MTAPSTPIDYAGRPAGQCPICYERPVVGKTLYGVQVCKKCLYRFANRRQIAYLVDSLLIGGLAYVVAYAIASQMVHSGAGQAPILMSGWIVGVVSTLVFAMRDGVGGQSPGKRLTDVQVVDATSGEPATLVQSFKRNWWVLSGLIPYLGGLVQLVIVIAIVIHMNKGPRFGDRFAGTRVIWKRYADSPVFGGDGVRCLRCGYDLTGNTSGQCPECGTPIADVPVATPAM